ncbi:MAG: ribokinase [Chlamydiae bacterium]|nr:MAG: ribokinase [Chlamydiota bacterium]
MQILNFGSINIDHVYAVNNFVRPGETISSDKYDIFAGGKGFNQSIALARAGAVVCHAGKIGKNAEWLLQRLEKEGVDITLVKISQIPTGHAIIQVIPSGENAIVLYGGANQTISEANITRALETISPGDYLLLQNEISSVAYAIHKGKERKLRVVFNPAPMTRNVRDYPLDDVDIFILNETEAAGLTGETEPEDVREIMCEQFPQSATVLTLGSKGAAYFDSTTMLQQPAFAVNAVDSTAAGDTFIGYFLAELIQSSNPAKALSLGCRAAAICVTRSGASDSIPHRKELET